MHLIEISKRVPCCMHAKLSTFLLFMWHREPFTSAGTLVAASTVMLTCRCLVYHISRFFNSTTFAFCCAAKISCHLALRLSCTRIPCNCTPFPFPRLALMLCARIRLSVPDIDLAPSRVYLAPPARECATRIFRRQRENFSTNSLAELARSVRAC